ncbi:MAG: hypothetical protein NUW01_14315 [Gemmatimonadaceae bacterium]|nr:hypothetical protein [Gemmatimonadaceae bacterium]
MTETQQAIWTITGTQGEPVTIAELQQRYPQLVAYDESGWEVTPEDLAARPDEIADGGYGSRDERRILFWASEADSAEDDGRHAVAEAKVS